MVRRVIGVVVGLGAVALLAACSGQTAGVTNVTATSATLRATGHTDDSPGHYFFQYATSAAALGTAAGKQTPTRGPVPAHTPSSGDLTFGESVPGLAPATTYAYRVCGGDEGTRGDVCMSTRGFTTPPAGGSPLTDTTPGVSSFLVPTGVTSVTITASGAEGGKGTQADAVSPPPPAHSVAAVPGGKGARVQAVIPVTAGERLELRVASAGRDGTTTGTAPVPGGAGGSNGVHAGGHGGAGTGSPFWPTGGGGGASTEVVLYPADGGAARTLVVAAGGGGGGSRVLASQALAAGGDGGYVGAKGAAGTDDNPNDAIVTTGGGGGTQSAGGTGGTFYGTSGTADQGGAGGSGGPDSGLDRDINQPMGGGGGGGGRYGGGGGGGGKTTGGCAGLPANCPPWVRPSGGGGGSSFTTTTAIGTPTFTAGARTGDGAVTLTWTSTGAAP